jgi:hypothetical protein
MVPTRKQRIAVFVRLGFGIAQMLGALLSFYLLARQGVSMWSVSAMMATTAVTICSVLIFGRGNRV